MDLQLSVFLLFILFTPGHSLSCYECMSMTGSCAEQTVKTCPIGTSQCESATAVTQIGAITSKVKSKNCAAACQSGSMNIGMVRMTSSCCGTDQCNAQDAPDSSNIPNGKQCFSCDGKSCSNTVSCSGTEDRCIKATGTFGDQSVVVKGCVSKSICDATSVSNVQGITCCEGNLCNGSQSVTQSLLFLCGSLLSYFLMH
ncbi:urokinase plasminogen activator surface receptor-like [Pimephales promelas]|uniref:urokinase plasminogen activator surface receptor-like n=1 Tax=Pimephales promelas TaxID=90988 RepID=UPI001955F349|nr:urokinase plasminogen activator surface receptor-like [Pimephales promelas]KAG1962522.1 urokinase plasminogen activator surface receptor-like [Pimephales promelas]